MQMTAKVSGSLMMVLVFAGTLVLTSNPRMSLAEISVDSYCQLSIQSMQQEVSNLQELIALVNQYKDDPGALAQQLEIKRAEFDQAKEALYSSFGITAEQYVTYMSRNSKAVNEFLEENPDVKQQIDDLSAQLTSLTEEEESLMGSEGPPEPPLP